MNIVDIILLALAVIFAAAGWSSGFVRAAGSLVAFVLSVIAAFYAMSWLHDRFGITFTTNPWMTVIAFVVLVVIANKIAGYVVEALDLIRRFVAIVPFVNLVNSIFGALLGLAQMATIILAFAYVTVTLIPMGEFRTAVLSSMIVSRAIDFETNAGVL